MLDEILGLPAHPLIIHAAVVLVPLLVLGAAAYAVLPRWRSRLGWVVAALAVAAPVSAFAAKESGERFLTRRSAEEPGLATGMMEHQEYGSVVMWTTIALGLAALALIVVLRGPVGEQASKALSIGTAVVTGIVDLVLIVHVALLFFGIRGIGPIILGLTVAAAALGVAGPRARMISRRVASAMVIAAVIGLAVGAGVHVLLSGHSGAVAVWSGA